MKKILYINIPYTLSNDVMDYFRLVPEYVSGCTMIDAQGFGQDMAYLSMLEKVVGTRRRKLLILIIDQQHYSIVLAEISKKWPRSDIFFWLQALQESGHISQFSESPKLNQSPELNKGVI